MVALEIPGPPVAFARAGSRGGQRFTPKPQRDFGNLIKLAAANAMDGAPPTADAVILTLRAVYVAPASWSKRKREATRWKTSKPDVDNLIKLAKDALTGIVYRDDAQVVEVSGQKIYGLREHMIITVLPA